MPEKGPSWSDRVKGYDFDRAKSWYEAELWKSDWRNRTGYEDQSKSQDDFAEFGADGRGRQYWNAQYNELLRNRVFDQYGGVTPDAYEGWSSEAKEVYDTWDKYWNKQYPDPNGAFASGGPGPGDYDKNWDFDFQPDPPPMTGGAEKRDGPPDPVWAGIPDDIWKEITSGQKNASDVWKDATDKEKENKDNPLGGGNMAHPNDPPTLGTGMDYGSFIDENARLRWQHRSHGDRFQENQMQQRYLEGLLEWADRTVPALGDVIGKADRLQLMLDQLDARTKEPTLLNVGGQQTDVRDLGGVIDRMSRTWDAQRAQDIGQYRSELAAASAPSGTGPSGVRGVQSGKALLPGQSKTFLSSTGHFGRGGRISTDALNI